MRIEKNRFFMNILQSVETSFSGSYKEAQYKFLNTAKLNNFKINRYKNPNLGALKEELSCDTAWLGPIDAKQVLVTISGTHGVEGFCGSGCQIDWMGSKTGQSMAIDTAILFIHAINPYGFSWCRRVTEEGCDLNRNFIDFSVPLPVNLGHDELVNCFVPSSLDQETMDQAESQIKAFRTLYGEQEFQKARKSGQYKHSHSMFFGGFGPTWSRKTLETIIDDYKLTDRDFVSVIDFHTGLGPFGYGEPISGHLPQTTGCDWVTRVYGESVGVPELGTSSSIPLNGTSRDLWNRKLYDRYAYIALEYGTYSQERSRAALREDHWLHNKGTVCWDAPETQKIKQQIKTHYHPGSSDWLEMVLFRSRQILRQANEALNSEKHQ